MYMTIMPPNVGTPHVFIVTSKPKRPTTTEQKMTAKCQRFVKLKELQIDTQANALKTKRAIFCSRWLLGHRQE